MQQVLFAFVLNLNVDPLHAPMQGTRHCRSYVVRLETKLLISDLPSGLFRKLGVEEMGVVHGWVGKAHPKLPASGGGMGMGMGMWKRGGIACQRDEWKGEERALESWRFDLTKE